MTGRVTSELSGHFPGQMDSKAGVITQSYKLQGIQCLSVQAKDQNLEIDISFPFWLLILSPFRTSHVPIGECGDGLEEAFSTSILGLTQYE